MKSRILLAIAASLAASMFFGCSQAVVDALSKHGDAAGVVTGGAANRPVIVIATTDAQDLYSASSVEHKATGTTNAQGSFAYSITHIATSDMEYLIALVDSDGDGDYVDDGSGIGCAGISFPSSYIPNLGKSKIVEGSNTINIACGAYGASGSSPVSLSFIAPSGSIGNLIVTIDSDTNLSNVYISRNIASIDSSTAGDFATVPNGTYYAYAHADFDSDGVLDAGEYFAYYGSYAYNKAPSSPNLLVGIIDTGVNVTLGSILLPYP